MFFLKMHMHIVIAELNIHFCFYPWNTVFQKKQLQLVMFIFMAYTLFPAPSLGPLWVAARIGEAKRFFI